MLALLELQHELCVQTGIPITNPSALRWLEGITGSGKTARLARQFGKDTVIRSGWGPSDTYMTFSAGFGGVYHNHLDANSFTLFRKGDLALQGGPYSVSFGEY